MKKLLIITQKIDKRDSILGFFHRWVEEFATKFEKITVICLEKGDVHLPPNVTVLSLGKENGRSRIKYLVNFYRHLWFEKDNYDVVFVHMNEEYVLLGGVLWHLLGKKVSMWRNHPIGDLKTRIAVLLCNKVFATSKYSYTAGFGKTKIMPVGVDTSTFRLLGSQATAEDRKPRSILFLARISPIKRPDVLIDALKLLRKWGKKFSASIYGDPLPEDLEYYQALKDEVTKSGLGELVGFSAAVPNDQTVSIYNNHEIFVNLSPSGMYDKTIFEAALCGALVLNSNENLAGKIDSRLLFKEGSVEDLAQKLKTLLDLNDLQKKELKEQLNAYAHSEHSLFALAGRLQKELDFKQTLIGKMISLVFHNRLFVRYQKLYRYLVSGGTSAFVDLGFLFFFTSVLEIWYLASSVLAFIIAVGVSFVMQKFWTFRDHSTEGWKAQAGLYLAIISTNNLGLNTILMYVFVDHLHIHYFLSQFVISGLIAIESYFVYQIFVFRKKGHQRNHAQ